MCGAVPCSAVSSSMFPLHWKLWLLLAILIICLSSPPLWNMTAWTSTTSLLFSPLLSQRWKLFFADKPCESFLHWSQVCVAAFSSCVCCIFWFIYIHLIVAPHARRVEALHVHYAGLVTFLFEIYMNAWIYLLLRRLMCILESHISCSGPGLEWSGVILEGAPYAATK